jgi:RNA polymerase sigma-70 factor (ECF subfamily)
MDRETVIRAQAGDQEAFTRLAGGLTPNFLATAHRILRDIFLAEDATQRAMLNIWRGLPRLREPDRFEAWSYRLLIRACYTEGRRTRHWSPAIGLLGPDDSQTPDPAGGVVDRDELERAFRRLSLDHRAVVVLRHYRHLSMDELADALGIPVGTAASRLHYAMRELRAAVEADARLPAGRVIS